MLPPTHDLICVVAWDICKATLTKPKFPLYSKPTKFYMKPKFTVTWPSNSINSNQWFAFCCVFRCLIRVSQNVGFPPRYDHYGQPQVNRRKSKLLSEPNHMAFQENSKGSGKHIICWSHVAGRSRWHTFMDPPVLGLAERWKFQVADGRRRNAQTATGIRCNSPTDDQKAATPPLPVQDILKKLNPKAQSIITTDCKSLYDLISRHAPPSCQEFRTLLQAKLIKEHINNGIQIRWVPSQAQLADALTKIMDPSVLRECLSIGRYSLHDEAQILRERSDSRARLQWLRNMTHGSNGEQASEWRKSQVVFHFFGFAWKIQMGTKWTWEVFFPSNHLEHFYRRERITKCCLFEMYSTVMLPAVSCYLPAADGEGSGVPVEGGIHRLGAIGGKTADHLVQGIRLIIWCGSSTSCRGQGLHPSIDQGSINPFGTSLPYPLWIYIY